MVNFAGEQNKVIPPEGEEYFPSLFWHTQSQSTIKPSPPNPFKYVILVGMWL